MDWPFHSDLLSPHLRKHTGFAPREAHKLDTLKPITHQKIGQYKTRLKSEDLFWIEKICNQGMKALNYQADEVLSINHFMTFPRYLKQGVNLFRGK